MSEWWEQTTPVKRWHLFSFLPFRPTFPAILLKTRSRNISSRWTSGKMGTKASLSLETWFWIGYRRQKNTLLWLLKFRNESWQSYQFPKAESASPASHWQAALGTPTRAGQWMDLVKVSWLICGWLVWALGLSLIIPDMSPMEKPGPCARTTTTVLLNCSPGERFFLCCFFFSHQLIQKRKRLLGKKMYGQWTTWFFDFRPKVFPIGWDSQCTWWNGTSSRPTPGSSLRRRLAHLCLESKWPGPTRKSDS